MLDYAVPLLRLMSTRKLAFGGVICALSSMCIIFSCVFHLIFPLAVSCVFYYLCAKKCGNACSILVVITSNIIGFIVGGVSVEILFSLLLFSPFSIIIYMTAELNKKLWQYAVRALVFAAFAAIIYVLFATVLKDIVGFGDGFKVGAYAFGAFWTIVMTLFGFALDRGCDIIAKRFFKND